MTYEPSLDSLETVEAYNARVARERQEREDRASRTGVACPGCRRELRWQPLTGLCYPPPTRRKAACARCNLTVDLEIPHGYA